MKVRIKPLIDAALEALHISHLLFGEVHVDQSLIGLDDAVLQARGHTGGILLADATDKRSQRGVAKPVGDEGAATPPTAPATVTPALTNISNMTPTELREASAAKGAELDSAIAEQQSIIDQILSLA